MKLALVTIITDRYEEMKEFYQQVLQVEPTIHRDNFAEFDTMWGNLGIWRRVEANEFGLRSMEGGCNNTMMVEFEINNIQREFDRLSQLGLNWVRPSITEQPWGHKAFYFRDPDGNVICFYRKFDPEEGRIYGS